MAKLKTFGKVILFLGVASTLCIGGVTAFYLKGLPSLVSNQKVIQYVQNTVKKQTNADLILEKPILKTSFSPDIDFRIEKVYLSKDDKKLLEMNNFHTTFSLKKILLKSIIIKKLVAENIFVDVNGLEKLAPQEEKKEEKKSDWNVDVFDALLGVKACEILYAYDQSTNIHIKGHHIGVNNARKNKRNVYFQIIADITRNNNHATITLNDNKNVFFKDNHFYIENNPLGLNKSNIFINMVADKKQNFELELFSKNFKINDIFDFLNTQIIENSIQKDVLCYFNDINGNLDFKITVKNEDFKGNLKLNEIKFKVKDVDNVPITLNKGTVDFDTMNVKLTGFEGFYDNNVQNKINFEGTVKDYFKTIDTDIICNAVVRNDFFKKHLSKMVGTDIEIKGEAPTRITLKSKNNIMDFVWYFMLKPGQNIKVANDYLPFEDTLRLMKSDMHLENMILDIKSLDYHMIPADKMLSREELKKRRKEGNKPQPIFKLSSSVDIANNNYIRYVGFEIPKPLPSEILNAILHENIFKKGKIAGKMMIDNKGSYPIVDGSMNMDKVLIPPLRMFVKEASFNTDNKLIHLKADGGFRRAKFNFNGDILNEMTLPIIVKDVNLSLENIDTLKLLEEFNNQNTEDNVIATDQGSVKVDNPAAAFDIRSLIIEKGHFHLDKGSYKEIEFANLDADLTLNKDGIISIKSNRFDFAQAQSSLRAMFDPVNQKYNVKLGVLKVNSDIIATALLDLKNEISGKGSGFLDISTDDSLKLSGSIKFKIDSGIIEKMGLIEYVLKCASLFRNTVTMISPATLADVVKVPEGYFDKITGELMLNNNVVTKINIKTSSPQLSNYIAGRYNIENGDTSLRVYTKFSGNHKGFMGFLRKLSLSALANRVPLNSRNDANYYAVELAELPAIDADEKDCQVYVTKIEGDVVNNNYISSLKKIK